MINKKILIVSTYPIENPLHGGQKRAKAIFDYYRTLFSDVKFVAITNGKYEQSSDDITIEDKKILKEIDTSPLFGDIIAGAAIKKDLAVNDKLKRKIISFKPDLVQVEQIYGHAELKGLLDSLGMKPKIILSSQNVEYEMKKQMVQKLNIKDAGEYLKRIKTLEKKAVLTSNLVVAVSKSDKERFEEIGAKNVVILPNGIEKIVPTREALAHWQKFKKDNKIKNLVTFVGSAHPPNFIGLDALVGSDLSFLPAGTALALAGSASEYIQEKYGFWEKQNTNFWQNAVPLGRLSDDNLAGLIQESEVIILPIVSGGGSNLKTAEAILSGKKIVATEYAFRSFEKYINLPNIYFANTSAEFKRSIKKALRSEYIKLSIRQNKLIEKVQWRYQLKRLNKPIRLLALGSVRYFFDETATEGRLVLKRIIKMIR